MRHLASGSSAEPIPLLSAETQRIMRQLVDATVVFVWATDAAGRWTFLSSSLRDRFRDAGELYLEHWLLLVHPDDMERVRGTLALARETRTDFQCEFRVVRSDGSLRWIQGVGAPRYADDGAFCGYSGATFDITAQHEAFARLAASEANYRLLAENTSDLICHCDGAGMFTYVSPSFRRSLGLDESMLVGTSPYDWVHPADQQALRDEVQRQLLASDEHGDNPVVESRFRHRDGHFLWFGSRIKVIRDAVTGAKAGSVVVARDITKERLAREDQRISEERFRNLTDLSADGYWETDEEGRLSFISGGLLGVFAVLPEEMLGQRRDSFAVDPDDPQVVAYRTALAQRERFRNISFASRLSPAGRMVHVSLSGEPTYVDGVFTGFRGVGRDVTAERMLQERLAQLADANRALIENSPDSIIVFDEAGRICRAEGAVARILGYEPEELLGRHYLDFLMRELHEQERREVDKVWGSLDYLPQRETSWRRKDGGTAHLSWAIRRSESQPDLIFATARDVTEVHLARAELDRANQRLLATLESIGDAFFSIDKQWRLTYVNLKTAQFVKRERATLLGKPLWEAVPEVVRSSVFPYYEQAMASGRDVFFETFYEPAAAWVEVRAYPHEDGMSVYFHDTTERRATERLVREREQRYRDMIALTPAGYLETDAAGVIVDVNPALCAMAGYPHAALVGRHVRDFIEQCPLVEALAVCGGTVSADGKEIVLRHQRGHAIHLLANLTIERNAAGEALSLIAFVTDITERKQSSDQLEYLATHDLLTGLPNRLANRRFLLQLLEAGPRDESIAVMFVDLDRFKLVNDCMGHVAGDHALQQVARRLQSVARPGDMVARFGGDEFIVTAHCAQGRTEAGALAAALQAALVEPLQVDGHEVFASASIGIAMVGPSARSKEVLYQNANTALFRAKAAGRGHFNFFVDEMAAEARDRIALEGALRHALERGELQLHYQPQVDLCSGRIVGVEALVRWQHPEWGQIAPARFIPVAEEAGLIVKIGSWVLRTACRTAAGWRAAGLGELRIAVNLSARQFAQTDVVRAVAAVLEETGLPPECLDLELTESMVMDDLDRTIAVLARLKQLGVKLSVDDFGTGYSSLAYLKQFPLDMLKIDRSFVQEIAHQSDAAAIPDAIIAMAHSLGMRVVAEGVEAEVQCEVLSSKMCDEIQGFLFAEPLAAEAMEQLLRSGRTLPAHLLRLHRRPRTLLLVDDEPNILSALRRVLRGAGYQIVTAGSGTEGLEALARQYVDVIVSDQRMPNMTGVDFLRTVKQLYPETVRIVLSGFTELQTVTSAVNEGAIYKFLTKPWDDAQLREHIAEAFAYKEMADENRRLGLEVRGANQGLAAANRQLEEALRLQKQQIQNDAVMLDIVREVLQHVPVPVVGLADDHVVVFANGAASELLGTPGLALGGDARELMPEVVAVLRGLQEGQSATAELGGRRYEITYRRMGHGTLSRGIMVTLLPRSLADGRGRPLELI
jgi:diguanylate cyclase (GGDEF)-like protein/PAS domain S-box-containing protein